jgi:hypothetical protein
MANANIHGLAYLFEVSLPTMLLYRFERLQFADWCHKHGDSHPPFIDVFGAIHLLRMIGRPGGRKGEGRELRLRLIGAD